MKILWGVLLSSILTISAFAADPEVKIGSFNWINVNDRTAEICGSVTGAFDAHLRISIKVDPGNSPGFYSAFPSPEKGGWCALVRTNTGRAEVSLIGLASEVQTAVQAIVLAQHQ